MLARSQAINVEFHPLLITRWKLQTVQLILRCSQIRCSLALFPRHSFFRRHSPPPSLVMQLAIPMWHWASLSASFWEASATCVCLTFNRPVKNMDSDFLYSFFDPVIHRIGSGSQPYVNKICSQSFVCVCRVQTSLVQKEDSLHDNLIRCFFNP